MTVTILQLAQHHSLGFVATALIICLVAGWLLSVLIDQSSSSSILARRWWLLGTAVVAGLGVWTTHFIAMLGYRSDIILDYGVVTTAWSAVLGILAVGLPLTISAVVSSRRVRTALGALSGLGIGAMHYTGMDAIQGCLQVHSHTASLLACMVGATCLALARGLPTAKHSHWMTCGFFTLGVCGTHFIAISGTRFVRIGGFETGSSDTVTLSIFTAAGAIVIFMGAFLTVIAAKRFEAQERAHSTILSTALHNMSNGLLFIDQHRRVGLFNDRYLEMFAVTREQLVNGMPLDALLQTVGSVNGWDDRLQIRIHRDIMDAVTSVRSTRCDGATADGRILDIEVRPVPGGGAVLTFDDVTSDREAQGRIAHLAFHDPLTGLGNRRALQLRMEEGFSLKPGYKLLLLDLDRFKSVNDTHGHGVGDRLLVEVANRLRGIVGEAGFVARIGGDEMAILVFGDLDLAKSRASEIVFRLSQPFQIDAISLTIGCSIGICSTDDAENPDELMKQADIALYETKRSGRGQASLYRPGMIEAVVERNRLEMEIGQAIANGGFHLVYQPFLSLADDRIVGYEALIRWNHPKRGMVSPVDFVPLSEETGQILEIGRWVLEEACLQAAGWAPDQHVAVNVSPVQLRSPLFVSHVTSALSKSGLLPSRLELELTETAMVADGAEVARILADLRRLGVKIAMDDFGTGYSSLAHLRDFPLDRIKIDRSFVAGAEGDRHSMALLVAITQIGKTLGIQTLAEGVESEGELSLLRSLGCDAVQGYLIGRPARPGVDGMPPAQDRHRGETAAAVAA
ncbi:MULTISPECIES: EAL domain-containing protein [unclassified Aureimonas]|uniref:bifunctional diguanylate cyclase/phosphodiesterase n=1 Tax=unclassified Aureimonas TaxID=2615206 RepID=UPI0006F901DB|nr:MULTISPECIES: EAL domain-containing protein [unclassified Aureimonas]KQT53045.1 diguanylate cyclase [Aureimonas sp. Leaf427]KQT80501.1 diguanylate cyclase [Aureimonas sp. Leaf460]